ncbi:hypothetical protein SISSUDRAFT_1015463 [Sistotremastrum suecicum HHB10207 ss-3]|uniref:Kinetochore protein SPC25 n=1 Tax=Sistotremastrum suecicum HHB10207 ss-3 TaxID=1314776 RepID=A0A166HM21_9AGAM|nr:hypothetical protein SISSUDRAFT_1015463 [Sistotremastrum suecicum HHB10207 ss-3]
MYTRPLQLSQILAQPHPEIDLRLESYEKSTRQFLDAVANYTAQAVDEITRRRDQHALLLKKEAEKRKAMEQEVVDCKVKEIELMKLLEQEQAERRDAESAVTALKRQLNAVRDKCASVDVEIEQYKANILTLRSEKMKERKILEKHASKTTPQVKALERRLHFTVEGVQKDMLLLRFTHIDPSDDTREFSIVIDISNPEYKVPTMTPSLPALPSLLAELNETRAFYIFIKRVRQAFCDLISPRTQ